MVKIQFLAHFSLNHLPNSVVSSIVLFFIIIIALISCSSNSSSSSSNTVVTTYLPTSPEFGVRYVKRLID